MLETKYTARELEGRVKRWMTQIGKAKPNSFACNLPTRFISCDPEHMAITFGFTTDPSMENPWGVTHGGVLAMALDWAMGVTSRTMLDQNDTPTVSMQVDYLHPVPLGCELWIQVTVDHVGHTLSHLQAKGYIDGKGEPCVCASGHYYLRNQPLILEDE